MKECVVAVAASETVVCLRRFMTRFRLCASVSPLRDGDFTVVVVVVVVSLLLLLRLMLLMLRDGDFNPDGLCVLLGAAEAEAEAAVGEAFALLAH